MKRSNTCWTSAGSDAVTPRSLLRRGRGSRGPLPGAIAVGFVPAGRAGRERHAVESGVADVLGNADALAPGLALQLFPQVVGEPDRRGPHTGYNAGTGSGFARDIGSGGENPERDLSCRCRGGPSSRARPPPRRAP